jgi:hypothetical protein
MRGLIVNRQLLLCGALLAAAPALTHAATEWATWNTAGDNLSSTGSFVDGRSVLLTANFQGITGPAAASAVYSVSPAVPGQPDGRNPSFTYAKTGPGTIIDAGAVVLTLNLTNFAVTADTILGLADLKFQYQLQLWDDLNGQGNLQSLADIQTADYNVTYDGSGLLADAGCFLYKTSGGTFYPEGSIYVTPNDAGGTYTHTGLCTFGNLPTATKSIRLVLTGVAPRDVEGIHVLLGGTASPVPLPPTLPLLGTAALAVLGRAWRRRRTVDG